MHVCVCARARARTRACVRVWLGSVCVSQTISLLVTYSNDIHDYNTDFRESMQALPTSVSQLQEVFNKHDDDKNGYKIKHTIRVRTQHTYTNKRSHCASHWHTPKFGILSSSERNTALTEEYSKSVCVGVYVRLKV